MANERIYHILKGLANRVQPIAKGGTGASTVASARNALGLGNTSGAVPVANGGTGATTASGALTNLGLDDIVKVVSYTSTTHTISADTAVDGTFSVSETGYTMAGVIGYEIIGTGHSYINCYELYPLGATTVSYALRNSHNQAHNISLIIKVLYVKDSFINVV